MEESEFLFKVIHRLKSDKITIIYTSHRMEEVFQIADRISVLRDGQYIGTMGREEATPEKIISMMVGRDVTELYPDRSVTIGDTILRGEGLTCSKELNNANFSLKSGEILGIAGLQGSGNSTLLKTIFGAKHINAGRLFLEEKELLLDSPQKAIANGIGYIPPNRQEEGLASKRSIQENIAYLNLRKVSRFGFIRKKHLKELSMRYKDDLSIKTYSLDQKVESLSGGNQQKVVLAKWLATQPKVLLMDDPTKGIDVGAKAEIHSLLGRLASKGIGIMLISSELPELLAMSDRILVMYRGSIVADLDREEATQEKVMEFATGAFTQTMRE
jgi:ABC-type sugar transport system ATPase subunit